VCHASSRPPLRKIASVATRVALQLDLQPRLLERLADRARSKSSPGLTPPPGGRHTSAAKCGFADQRDPLRRIEDEQRHVVRAHRVVRRDAPLAIA